MLNPVMWLSRVLKLPVFCLTHAFKMKSPELVTTWIYHLISREELLFPRGPEALPVAQKPLRLRPPAGRPAPQEAEPRRLRALAVPQVGSAPASTPRPVREMVDGEARGRGFSSGLCGETRPMTPATTALPGPGSSPPTTPCPPPTGPPEKFPPQRAAGRKVEGEHTITPLGVGAMKWLPPRARAARSPRPLGLSPSVLS